MFFPFVDNVVILSSNGMVEGFWEPHLKDSVAATQFEVAIVFLLMGGAYMLVTVPTGSVIMGIIEQLVIYFTPLHRSVRSSSTPLWCPCAAT